MSNFVKYPKIRTLGARENRGILGEEIIVQEKLDGAQASIICFPGETWQIASRNTVIDSYSDFRGLRSYTTRHPGLLRLIQNPNYVRIYGDWFGVLVGELTLTLEADN